MDGGMIQTEDGQIDIPLDGGTATLTANLFAAKGINRHFGGFQDALNRVSKGDLDAFTAIVRYGLGLRTDAEAKLLDERVFRAGVLNLTAPLTEYLLILANGGKGVGGEPVPLPAAPGDAP